MLSRAGVSAPRRLKVTVWRCRNLANKDGWGQKNDPYVTLTVGAEKLKTEARDNAGAAPKWPGGSIHVFEATEGLESLEIRVKDVETIGANQLIGEHTFDLAAFIDEDGEDGEEDKAMEKTWLQLKDGDDETGEVMLELTWAAPPAEGEPPVQAKQIGYPNRPAVCEPCSNVEEGTT